MAETKKKEHVLMEGNLLEYPIFSMQKRRVDRTTEEYSWQETLLRLERNKLLEKNKKRLAKTSAGN
jgi:hypothetical protein